MSQLRNRKKDEDTQAKLHATQILNKQLRDENKTLAADVEAMRNYVAIARKANQRKHCHARPGPKRRPADTRRVVMGDLHAYSMVPRVVATLLRDVREIDPHEIVLLGDMLECGGFLAQHHTLGYVAQTDYTYEDDIAAGNQFLDALIDAAPNAEIHYLEGNHEGRISKWCVTQALRKKKDAQWLIDHIGPESVLALEERGIRYYRQSVKYDGLSIPGTIRLHGNWHYTHGITTCKHAAAKHVQRFGGHVAYGHTHRTDMATTNTVQAGYCRAFSPGCLCERQPMWQHTNPTEWAWGYAVQFISRGGVSSDLLIPIDDQFRSNLSMIAKA